MHLPRSFGPIGRTSGRSLIVALLLLTATALAPRAAWAHGEGDSDKALVSVREAIAYIINTPNNMDGIEDKLGDAIEAEDEQGVQIPLVEQAKEALEGGDMHKVRGLLEQSIGAHVHIGTADPVAIGQVPPPVTGTQTGTLAAIDALPGRPGLTGGDWAMLVISAVVGLSGLALSAWLRPHLPSVRRGEAA